MWKARSASETFARREDVGSEDTGAQSPVRARADSRSSNGACLLQKSLTLVEASFTIGAVGQRKPKRSIEAMPPAGLQPAGNCRIVPSRARLLYALPLSEAVLFRQVLDSGDHRPHPIDPFA